MAGDELVGMGQAEPGGHVAPTKLGIQSQDVTSWEHESLEDTEE